MIDLRPFLSLAAIACVLPQVARAQDNILDLQDRGFYLGAGIGANIQEGNRFRGGGADANVKYDPGLAGLADVGYAFGNGVRLEIEPGYRYNDVHVVSGATSPSGGHTQIASLMANAIYDFDVHTPVVPLIPHVGVGAGYAHLWNQSGPHNGLTVRGEDDVPAFQAIAGVEYAVQPNVKLGLDYRYFVAHDADFPVNNGLTSRAGDFNDHSLLVTLRFEFGAPRAVPAAAPAAAPAPVAPAPQAAVPPSAPQGYQVYFNFDSDRLTEDARSIVDRAGSMAKQGNTALISVTGHTDTTGGAPYNQQLSERRAAAVKAELVRAGVPTDEITTRGVGKDDLAVPTADQVREARNRRVVIEIQTPGA